MNPPVTTVHDVRLERGNGFTRLNGGRAGQIPRQRSPGPVGILEMAIGVHESLFAHACHYSG